MRLAPGDDQARESRGLQRSALCALLRLYIIAIQRDLRRQLIGLLYACPSLEVRGAAASIGTRSIGVSLGVPAAVADALRWEGGERIEGDGVRVCHWGRGCEEARPGTAAGVLHWDKGEDVLESRLVDCEIG